MNPPNPAVLHISLLLVTFVGSFFTVAAIDNSTIPIIKDGDRLVSSNKNFALGFFSFNNSTTRRYVGIWYNTIPQLTLVWVANRNQPLIDTSGTLALDRHGNLLVFSDTQTISLWSTNATLPSNDVSVQLWNTGNLALVERQSRKVIWQSFDYPSDVLIPYMKLGVNRRTGFSWFLTSWKAQDDPGIGNFSCRINPTGYPQLVLYQGDVPWWRGGPWTGRRWAGVPEMTRSFIINTSYIDNAEEVSITNGVTVDTVLMRMTLDESGSLHRSTWNEQDQKWNEFWSAPTEWCDKYNRCGPNSNCDPYNTEQFQCKCLPGFEPRSNHNWFLRDPSGGCVRKRPNATCGSGEGFVKVERVKVPDSSTARADKSMSLEACEQACMKDCKCTAYTSANETTGFGCVTWYGELLDTRTYANVGQDLYVRVDAVELGEILNSPPSPFLNQIYTLLIPLFFFNAIFSAQYSQESNRYPTKKVIAIVVVCFVALVLLVASLVYLWELLKKSKTFLVLVSYHEEYVISYTIFIEFITLIIILIHGFTLRVSSSISYAYIDIYFVYYYIQHKLS